MDLVLNYNTDAKKQAMLFWQKYKSVFIALAIIAAVIFFGNVVEAGTTQDEFSGTADKFEGWIKGNLGKAIAFVALIIGAGIAAFKKDGMALVFAIFIAIGLGIIVGIINATFTAVI